MSSFDQAKWQRWFADGRDEKRERKPPSSRTKRVLITIAALVITIIILSIVKGFYADWLWFSSLGYGSVFTTILSTRVLAFFVAASIFSGIFLGNLMLATRLAPGTGKNIRPWTVIEDRQRELKWGVILGTAFLAIISGVIAQSNWETILLFLNGQPFGTTDPVFNQEISFYVFSLPFYYFIRGWLIAALVFSLIGSIITYYLAYSTRRLKFDYARPVLFHTCGLLIAILAFVAWGYRLDIWELVFSTRGVVFGASFADINAKVPALWILFGTVFAAMGLFISAIIRRRRRLVGWGIGLWIAVAVIGALIVPSAVQRFQVQPNELARETPYIQYNIEYTREAFALNRIDEQSFPAEKTLTAQEIADNQVTINNIRLWDHRPLKDTYNQIQAIRLYYDFNDVDIDRYVIDDEYRQVMLSARELTAEKLSGEAQTWVNRILQFTHGYGIAMSPVNEISAEGLPVLLVQDIPPVGEFSIEQPQIYFGEKTNNYVIVKTKTQEFDYPMGDENVYTYYEGDGGVSIGNFLRRVVYAWQFGDLNILISGELTPESEILYHRNIRERINTLAPFLRLDNDPYLVVMDNQLFWIQDAYTTTNRYPYSEPINTSGGEINYIRNSVKAVINAYDGSVTFYIADPGDALIQTYQEIFPALFQPMEQMPDLLKQHLRYPEDMFSIQASVYQSYHMQDARVFYNKEDLWALPKEVYYGEQQQPVQPYYVIMRLPSEEQEEFLLMLPFTPVNKNNTIGWMAARCDGENYGNLIAYYFPKERLVYGPSQIENRIQQDTAITEQLALWSRGGSNVIRGNLLMIPLGDSNLYVEPVFLQAQESGLPELKRVIVAAGDQIAMEPTLAESLAAIFGTELPPVTPEEPSPPQEPGTPEEPGAPVDSEIAELVNEAQLHYDLAEQYLKDGNWAKYGEELAALKAVLEQLAELTATE